jgi:hypothetical protein
MSILIRQNIFGKRKHQQHLRFEFFANRTEDHYNIRPQRKPQITLTPQIRLARFWQVAQMRDWSR